MEKRNRNYIMNIEFPDGSNLEIKMPFTCEFDVKRANFGSSNVGTFRIYNLSKKNRDKIRNDQWSFKLNKRVTFKAGYENNLPKIFTGVIQHAHSSREDNNMVTSITCFDAGDVFVKAQTNQQFPANTKTSTVINNLVDSLKQYNIAKGAIGTYSGESSRGSSYSGSTTDILNNLTGGGFFIDNGVAHCLNEDECLDVPTFIISPQSGLLNTPVRETTFVNFEMIFEPQIRVGQRLKLESKTDSSFNTDYVVKSLNHKGIISAAVSGSAITSIGSIAGTNVLVKGAR